FDVVACLSLDACFPHRRCRGQRRIARRHISWAPGEALRDPLKIFASRSIWPAKPGANGARVTTCMQCATRMAREGGARSCALRPTGGKVHEAIHGDFREAVESV